LIYFTKLALNDWFNLIIVSPCLSLSSTKTLTGSGDIALAMGSTLEEAPIVKS